MLNLLKQLLIGLGFMAALPLQAEPVPGIGRSMALFDARTLQGWEGNTNLWRVQEGALTGGSLTEMVKQNDFLATLRDFTNFIVRFKIKLTGSEGFINSGFQIRSQRVPGSSEMAGYQCDYGDPNWWGAIYDESRRNKVMSATDMQALGPVIKRNDWNDYVIRADGPRVTTWINGVQGTDYFEADAKIPDWGKLGIQVHGGGKALVQVKDISIEELPATSPGKKFIGAPEPQKRTSAGPLSPDEEKASFTLPPGFQIELVASESEGIGKFVAVDFDLQGRMWSMTALEYPVDANESPAVAKALYESAAKDKVLVWDKPFGPGPHNARVFAEGLAIPLGLLPYKNGAYVQHGSEIVFLADTDADGRADKREVILSGFGVQDSHLFPHQFTRAPGNWVWMAQGAFNYGKVRTSKGKEQQFDQTRMARFRYDGSYFDITSQGPCNIWGLAMNAEGETWIQEANDYGYPTMPFHPYANYPGCSDSQFKSYAPEFPGTAPDFRMGGTGLSGLALSDSRGAWPEAFADVMYLANPIIGKIQAIKIHRDGPRYRLQKLPDFVQSSDEMFRPVALRLGPDGCLYLVDWYNKIISHNEVPRNHPERDKKRGRIWRVKHRDQKTFPVPDFTRLNGDELLSRLGGASLAQHHLAWQAIGERQLVNLAPKLKIAVAEKSHSTAKRIGSLWALEGLGKVELSTLKPLLSETNRNLRREAVRVFSEANLPAGQIVTALEPLAQDPDPEVRAEIIRTTGPLAAKEQRALALCLTFAKASLSEPTAKSTHSGKIIKVGEAYEREFERYLVRLFLEPQPQAVSAFLDSDASKQLPLENRLVAALALEPRVSARQVAQLLPSLNRAPGDEEILRLAQFPDEPGVSEALKVSLQNPSLRNAMMEALLKVRNRLDASRLTPVLLGAARNLFSGDAASIDLAFRLTSAFKLSDLDDEIASRLSRETNLKPAQILGAIRALGEINSRHVELVAKFANHPEASLREESIRSLGAIKSPQSAEQLFKLWRGLTPPQRRASLSSMAGHKSGADAVLAAVQNEVVGKAELEGSTLDKLQAVLGKNPRLDALLAEMDTLLRPVLRLDGKNESYVDSNIELAGPFTVEAWVKLEEGISNLDGILGAPETLDMNFAGAQFRVWVGGGQHDVAIAQRKTSAGVWTHCAVTRDEAGVFKIYLNGELDGVGTKRNTNTFTKLDVGRTIPVNGGTAGALSEFRVWNRDRTDAEIRASFDQSFADTALESHPKNIPGLVHWFGAKRWGKLNGAAKIERTDNFPPLLTTEEAKAQEEKFARFRSLAQKSGDPMHGKALVTTACLSCHNIGGTGGQVGPVLSGAGASGVEALLRNILTPNAAMEAGYRVYRVELKDGDVIDGLLVSQDKEAVILRRPNTEDLRIPQSNIRHAEFTRLSMMPEGLLEAFKPEEVTDLFSYLKTLK